MREKEEENQALLDTCDSSQGAPSGREEVLGKISPRQDPHIKLSSRALLWITRCIWESCVCDMFFSGLHQTSRASY